MDAQRLDFRFRITWEGRWHVGSGYQSAAADRLVRRLGGPRGTPVVPGSQIKGVLRHQCERLAASLGVSVQDPHAPSLDQQAALIPHFVPLCRSPLLIDRLFGSRYQGGCLFVENALPEHRGSGLSSLRTRTAIDRATGTVQEHHLFTTEVLEPDSWACQGALRARHPADVLTPNEDCHGFPFEYSLLIAGLLTIDAFGGDKSVGLGRCHTEILEDSLRWNGNNVLLDVALRSFEEEEWATLVDLVREEMRP